MDEKDNMFGEKLTENVADAAQKAENAADSLAGNVADSLEAAAGNAADSLEATVGNAADSIENAAEKMADKADSIEAAAGNAADSIENAAEMTKKAAGEAKSKTGVIVAVVIVALLLILAGGALIISNKMKKDGRVAEDASVLTAVKAFFSGEDQSKDKDVPGITGQVKTNNDTQNADGENQDGNGLNTDGGDSDGQSTETKGVLDYDITVKLGEYKGLEVEYSVEEITEEQVDAEVDYFCENMAEQVELYEGTVEEYDDINFSCKGYIDGATTPDENTIIDNMDMCVGAESYIEGFQEGIVGHEVGETFSVDLNFPDPYSMDESLSGKPVRFEITINCLYDYEIPELTDELVAENTDYNTVAEYREYCRGLLEDMAKENADADVEYDIKKKFVDNCEFGGEIDRAVEDQYQVMLDSYNNSFLSMYGIDAVTLYAMYGVSEEEFKQMVRDESELTVKYYYAVWELADKENFTVSDEEYEESFKEIFEDVYGMTKEEVLEIMTQEEMDKYVQTPVLQRKTDDLIMNSAVVKGKN